MTTLQPKPVRLDGSLSHGDWLEETFIIPRQADPSTSEGGAGTSAGDLAAAGGCSGFPTAEPLADGLNLWDLVIGDDAAIASGVAAGLEQLQEQPGRLASARLKALAEVQAILRSHSNGIDWEHPVAVPAGDLVLVVQLAMQRLS